METEKKEILLVLPEVPYPVRAQGISIRYLPIIKHLHKEYILDLIVFTKEPCDKGDLEPLNKYCRNVSNVTQSSANNISKLKKFIVRCGFFLPWALPRSWTIYGGELITQKLSDLTEGVNYSVLLCVSGYIYPYISKIKAEKKIVDFIDSPSLLSRRNVIGSNRAYLIRKFESLKTYLWEAKIIRESDEVIYISDYDACSISKNLASMQKRHVIPNGFSVDDYNEQVENSIKTPSIGFLGNMSYYPNIESVHLIFTEIFSTLKSTFSDLSMYIIGRSPDESVKKLSDNQGVYVTGEVPTIWPYLNSVDIFVFPLVRGAGLKNKILEAMYAGRPVVTTAIGNEGIGAVSGRDLIVCETSNEFNKEIIKLFNSPECRKSLGEAGKIFVEERFSWDKILEDLEDIITSQYRS